MRTTGPRAKRLVRIAVIALAVAAMLGFAAEPSTSTQFDVREGRGVVVVHSAHQLLVQALVADDWPEPERPAPVLVALAIGLSAAVIARAHDARGRLPTSLGRAGLARRGPPALV